MPPPDESALDKVQSRLYKQGGTNMSDVARTPLHAQSNAVPRGWDAPPAPVREAVRPPKPKLPLAVRFLIGAAVFFVVAGAVASFFLLVGGNSVSTDNIRISIDPPNASLAGGDTLSLLITVENHNPVAITGTTLTVDFPEGTRSAEDVTKDLPRDTEDLGDLAAGQAVTRTVRAVPFGSANQAITIPVKVQYKTAGSNAVFVKEQEYSLTLTTSPVSVTATSVSQISSGQQFSIALSVRSNASKPLTDIALAATYPFGFAVASTSVPSSNGLFTIGTLDPGQEKKITVTGALTGTDSDTRVFHWSVGSTASSTNGTLGLAYATAETDVSVAQPFLGLSLSLNGSSASSPTVSPGQQVQGTLKWKNNLNTPVLNGKITLAFSGGGYDPRSVSTQNGFYQSSDGTITFDRDHNSGLANLAPGDTGSGTFTFTVKSANDLAALHNPAITLSVSAAGTRVDETGVSGTLSSSLTNTLKIASGLALSSRVVHTVGPFTDSGPWPPVNGTETMYTVLLSAQNGVNAVAGGTVTMTLPSYVRFTGATSPANGTITYADGSRTVKWVVGDLASGASAQAAFQIAFLPSVSQVGSSPTLTSSATMTATDRFTQTAVTASVGALTTQASTDPAYSGQDGIVK